MKNCQLPKQEKSILSRYFIKLLIFNPSNKLTNPVKLKKIVKKYAIHPQSQAYTNLMIAYEIINRIRSYPLESTSHLQTNAYTDAEYKRLDDKYYQMDQQSLQLSKVKLRDFCALLIDPITTTDRIHAETALAHGTTNCDQLARIAKKELKDKYNIESELWVNEKGRHVFTVFGTGKAKTVLDIWAGKAYPYTAIEKEFRCWSYLYRMNYGNYNMTTFYNPHYHGSSVPLYSNPNNIDNRLHAKAISALYLFAALLLTGLSAILIYRALTATSDQNESTRYTLKPF
jgi:hypothetical protein